GRVQQAPWRMTTPDKAPYRSGFACFVGRPNTGKSTLTNALVGSKVAIMSDRPQTTRHAIRGVVRRPDAQLVVVDTPGFHRPRTLLGQRLTDEPERVMAAELIREAALAGVRDELPHSIAVVVEEMRPRADRDDLDDIEAVMFVERDSQKGIVIGVGGSRLREIGTTARSQIEALLGTKVYLDLRVKVAKDWQRDPKQL